MEIDTHRRSVHLTVLSMSLCILVACSSDPNSRSFQEAVRIGDEEGVRYFIERGADPNEGFSNGLTPLMVAAKYNHAAVAKALLEGGSKPHFKSEAAPFNAVVIARLYDHIETFSELAPDAEKTRPLADSDDFEKVSLNAQSSLEEIVALTALPGI